MADDRPPTKPPPLWVMTPWVKTLLITALTCFAMALGSSLNEDKTSWKLLVIFLPASAIPLFLLIRDFWKPKA